MQVGTLNGIRIFITKTEDAKPGLLVSLFFVKVFIILVLSPLESAGPFLWVWIVSRILEIIKFQTFFSNPVLVTSVTGSHNVFNI